jgi:hypothetical protein
VDFSKLLEVPNLRPIKGVPYPVDVSFRHLIVTGPPGCGKSSRIEELGGWPGEAFLDLTRAGWWRDRNLATRPREVHLGFPFAGHREGLALFEEAQEGTPELIFEPQRVRLPPMRQTVRPMDWQRRFLLEFLLPPAKKVLAVRRERAAEGTHPVDQEIYREQIEHQLELYFRVAEIFHNAGFRVLVRDDFEANPRVFPDPPLERSLQQRQATPSVGWLGTLFGRRFSNRPETVIRELDSRALAGESLLFDDRLLPLEIRQGKARLRLYRERLIVPGKRMLDSLILLDPESLASGVSGFASLAPGELVRPAHGDKLIKDSLPIPGGARLKLSIENAADGIVITDLHSDRGTEVVALGDSADENLPKVKRDRNVRRIEKLFGRPLAPGPTDVVHETLRAVNERLQSGTWRPVDADKRPGALVELPFELCPIIVGDLHGNVDNLLKMLCVNNFLAEIEAKNAVLIFLGDAVHPEDPSQLADMESSLLMMDLILRLMATYPDQVIYVRGNHDSFSAEVTKEGVPQGRLWRKHVKQTRGVEFLEGMESFYASLPLIVASEDFVACHAGPPQGKVSRKRLINAAKHSSLVHELTWNRFKGPGNPAGYFKHDVKALRSALGLAPKTTMLVSHNPQRDGQSVWLNAGGIKRHHVIHSAGFEEVALFARIGGQIVPLRYRAEPLLSFFGGQRE